MSTALKFDVYVYFLLQKGLTPLYVASQNGHSQVAELLLSKGADINLPEQVHVCFSPTSPSIQRPLAVACPTNLQMLLAHYILLCRM